MGRILNLHYPFILVSEIFSDFIPYNSLLHSDPMPFLELGREGLEDYLESIIKLYKETNSRLNPPDISIFVPRYDPLEHKGNAEVIENSLVI